MKRSPYRPLILKRQRRKLPPSHGDASSTLAGKDTGGQDNGSLIHQQARTGEHNTNRKTPGTPKAPAGAISHPAISDGEVVAIPTGKNVLSIMEALATKGKEWGSSKPNKFIVVSCGSSSPTVEATNQLFKSEDKHSIPYNKVKEEDDAGPSSAAMNELELWDSRSQPMEGERQEGNSSIEAPSCELDCSLTNIQWLGKMSSDSLSPCSMKNGMEKENQTPKQEAAVKTEEGSAPPSWTAFCQESFAERPPYSYMAMIEFAINSTEKKRMTLKDIYTWIEDHFPYFKHVAKPRWKNSIRHNLSLHDMFVRETPANSKISFWTIRPEANRYLTLDQVFKKSLDAGSDSAPSPKHFEPQQKRRTPDLQKNLVSTGGIKPEPQPACRKMKPLLPRVNSYLVPIQFPLSQSVILQPSAKIPVLVSQSMSEPVQSSKRVHIAPKICASPSPEELRATYKVLPTSVEPTLFLPEISVKEEPYCEEESSPFASHQSTKEDACQINRELFPTVLSIKKESDLFHSDEWVPLFQTVSPKEEPPVQDDEELNSFLPVPEKQKRRLAALEQPFQEMPDTKRQELHETGRSRRKQLLALPCSEQPVLLLPSSHAFTMEHNSSFEQDGHLMGSMSHLNFSQGECGPFKTPITEIFCKLPASSTPCKIPTTTSSLIFTDTWRLVPFLKEASAQEFSPRRSPPIPLLPLQQNLDLSTSLRPSMFDSLQPLLLNTEANDTASGPLISSTASSHESPPEFQASILPENCSSLEEGSFLDPMNDSLSKILLDVSLPGFDESNLGTDLSWSQFIPDLK